MKRHYLLSTIKQTSILRLVAVAALPVMLLGIIAGTIAYNEVALRYCLSGTGCTSSAGKTLSSDMLLPPSPTPWNTIGGCGASGSGSVGDGIQWIGNGVQGGLVDMEIMSRYTIRQNFRSFSVTPRLSFRPTWTTEAGVSVPIMSKSGSVQYQANQEDLDRTTGGMGDVTLDFSRSIGFSGEYRLQLSMTLPTGQYDIKRGAESNLKFLPVDFQMGSGMYNASLLLSWSSDIEDGLLKFDAMCSYPFNMHPIGKKNSMLDEYYSAYDERKDSERFYYRFKPYGESDLGAYTPPSVSLAGYYADRAQEGYVHSYGIMLSAPLAVAWIPEPDIHSYAPIKDPGHKTWSGALLYGLEFSRAKYPMFLTVSKPIHDRSDALGRIDGPDWQAFMNEWVFAFGIKSTFL